MEWSGEKVEQNQFSEAKFPMLMNNECCNLTINGVNIAL